MSNLFRTISRVGNIKQEFEDKLDQIMEFDTDEKALFLEVVLEITLDLNEHLRFGDLREILDYIYDHKLQLLAFIAEDFNEGHERKYVMSNFKTRIQDETGVNCNL